MKMQQQGYMIVLTLMIISLSVFLVTYMMSKGSVYISFAQAVVYREQAKVLAYGAMQLSISQLQAPGLKEEEQKKATEPEKQKIPDSWQKKMLQLFFPILNQSQIFSLEEHREGIDAQVQLCVSSEDGKININNMYDFKQKQFKNNTRPFLQYVFEKIERIIGAKNMLAALEQFLKNRTTPLEDITELLLIPEFAWFKAHVFFEPLSSQMLQEKKENKMLYLSDIFTIWSKDAMLEPWFLSSSLQILFGLKSEHNKELRKEILEKQLPQFKVKTTWKTDWNASLNPVYGTLWQNLPEVMHAFLKTVFDPTVFSVRVKAQVNGYEQQLLGIFERAPSTSQDDRYQFHVKLRKIYWL